MEITGKNIIGNNLSATGKDSFQAINPATGESLPGQFHLITEEERTTLIAKTAAAFKIYS